MLIRTLIYWLPRRKRNLENYKLFSCCYKELSWKNLTKNTNFIWLPESFCYIRGHKNMIGYFRVTCLLMQYVGFWWSKLKNGTEWHLKGIDSLFGSWKKRVPLGGVLRLENTKRCRLEHAEAPIWKKAKSGNISWLANVCKDFWGENVSHDGWHSLRQFRDVAKKWTFGFLNRKMLIISGLRFFCVLGSE